MKSQENFVTPAGIVTVLWYTGGALYIILWFFMSKIVNPMKNAFPPTALRAAFGKTWNLPRTDKKAGLFLW